MEIVSWSYFPLFLVFISGVGFSVQSLFIKLLEEQNFQNSFQILFVRGLFQSIVSYVLIFLRSASENNAELSKIILDTSRVLIPGSLLSFGGIACIFLTTEYVPVGFAMILDRQSIIFGSIFACIFLGEPWLFREFFGTVVSLFGVVLIADPDLIAALINTNNNTNDSSSTENEDINIIGFIYGFLAALFAAGSYTTIRAMGTVTPVRWEIVAFVQGTLQLGLSLPCMWLMGKSFVLDLSVMQWGMIIAAAVIGTLSQYAQTLGTLSKPLTNTAISCLILYFS